MGQRGLNIQDFCKAFNAATEGGEKGVPLPVVITCYEDRTFTFVVKQPPMSVLIRKALGLEKGSGKPHLDKVGKLTRQQAEDIAKEKMTDLNTQNLDAAVLQVAGDGPAAWVLKWNDGREKKMTKTIKRLRDTSVDRTPVPWTRRCHGSSAAVA